MASRPSRKVAPVDFGIAAFVPEDQVESGDLSVVKCTSNRALIAAIDGIGHGKSAAHAARTAAAILESFADDPLVELVQSVMRPFAHARRCSQPRSIDFRRNLLTWIGVGNVQGVLLRSSSNGHSSSESLLLRPGVVGSQLPNLQAATLLISPGDTLAFATDGIRSDFSNDLFPYESRRDPPTGFSICTARAATTP